MKKLYLTIFLIIFGAALWAQSTNPAGRRVTVGLSFGPSIDWLSPKTDNYQGDGIKIGVKYGIPVDINFTKQANYYFSTGLFFSHNGGKLKFMDNTILDSNTYSVLMNRSYSATYLIIPTGIKLKTPSFKNFVFAGNFGLSHGFLLKGKKLDQCKIGDRDIVDPKKVNYKELLFFKESVYVGVGVEYIIKDDFRANFFINYNYTFTNFFSGKALNEYYGNIKEKGNLGSIDFVFGVTF